MAITTTVGNRSQRVSNFENEGLVELGLTTQGIICNGNMKSWQFNRKFLTHSIMSPNFLKDFVQETQSLFNEMGNYWSNLGTDFQIDLAQWMYRFTTDTMLKSTTGKPFYSVLSYYNTLAPTKIKVPGLMTIEPEEFLALITNWLTMVMYFLFFSNLIRHYIPGFRQFTQKLLAKNEQLDEKVLTIIEERRKDIESSSETPLQNDILTSLLIANTSRDTNSSSNDEALKPLTNNEIRQIMLDVFIAGIDTVFQLSREDVIGGLKFKPGTMFCANQQGIHRSTQYWKDPEKFIPERFVKGSEFEAKNLEKNAYNPFGGGLRLCPGRHVAMAELKVLIVLLFGKYDVQLANPKSPLKYSLVALNQCNELKVLIRPKTN
ncbi:5700_t:CDS:2 [Ambispora gerdemannii]|uniref:5700_t:CDS:1 n=1 Tax=Ambispora gerdemannii TaxID=144530 RepID=A0A9N8V0U6_9GLOM|nr:5700_t:CDS:2 [Ambispora gerdemannii]